MTKINIFTIERLHNGEDFGFQKLIELETIHLTLESDKEVVRIYKAALLDYDVALNSSTSNSHTVEVVHIDLLADSAWRGLNALIKVTLKHPKEAYRTTARESYNIIHKYGDITNMGYNSKYGSALNLLQEFNALGEEKQHQIGIYDWLVELQTRYDEFMVATSVRAQEEAHNITGIIKEMRTKADDAYRALVERVNALALINGVEQYASFIANVNVLINESQTVIAARKTRAKHHKEPNDGGDVKG